MTTFKVIYKNGNCIIGNEFITMSQGIPMQATIMSQLNIALWENDTPPLSAPYAKAELYNSGDGFICSYYPLP